MRRERERNEGGNGKKKKAHHVVNRRKSLTSNVYSSHIQDCMMMTDGGEREGNRQKRGKPKKELTFLPILALMYFIRKDDRNPDRYMNSGMYAMLSCVWIGIFIWLV